MSNYCFDLPGCTYEKRAACDFTIEFTHDDLRKVTTIGGSSGKILALYESYYNQPDKFIGYVDGDHIGATLARLVSADELYKIPTRYDCHCYSNMPERSKFKLFTVSDLVFSQILPH